MPAFSSATTPAFPRPRPRDRASARPSQPSALRSPVARTLSVKEGKFIFGRWQALPQTWADSDIFRVLLFPKTHVFGKHLKIIKNIFLLKFGRFGRGDVASFPNRNFEFGVLAIAYFWNWILRFQIRKKTSFDDFAAAVFTFSTRYNFIRFWDGDDFEMILRCF